MSRVSEIALRLISFSAMSLLLNFDAFAQNQAKSPLPAGIQDAFEPPEAWQGKLGAYRSPLIFKDGRIVQTEADWKLRRSELLSDWNSLLGTWPALITEPKLEVLEETRRENIKQIKVRFLWAPNELTTGYLLIPDGEGKRPAVLTVYYEPETAIGLGKEHRDFGLQLARRGFVVLSIGTTEATAAQPIRSIIHRLKKQRCNRFRCWPMLRQMHGMCWRRDRKWTRSVSVSWGIRSVVSGPCLQVACSTSSRLLRGPILELFSTTAVQVSTTGNPGISAITPSPGERVA